MSFFKNNRYQEQENLFSQDALGHMPNSLPHSAVLIDDWQGKDADLDTWHGTLLRQDIMLTPRGQLQAHVQMSFVCHVSDATLERLGLRSQRLEQMQIDSWRVLSFTATAALDMSETKSLESLAKAALEKTFQDSVCLHWTPGAKAQALQLNRQQIGISKWHEE